MIMKEKVSRNVDGKSNESQTAYFKSAKADFKLKILQNQGLKCKNFFSFMLKGNFCSHILLCND